MTKTFSQEIFSTLLVSPAELWAALVGPKRSHAGHFRPPLVILCAAWFLSTDKRQGSHCFHSRRIPGSRFFDLDLVSDTETTLPHMLPSASDFADAMGALGVTKEAAVVVYDTEELGIFSAPRVAWTLKVFGHARVHILNNFRLWVTLGYPTESGPAAVVVPRPYTKPTLNHELVVDFENLRRMIQQNQTATTEEIQILDSRAYDRWSGKAPELRPELATGHMPFSTNILLDDILDPVSRAFLPVQRLRGVLHEKGVDRKKQLITTCGSGITAAAIQVAISITADGTLNKEPKLYDGSWR